jgi:dihydroflavonol-4-reductase
VVHVASPLGHDVPRDHNELIVPARDGALRVLGAACRAQVQRVVMTSSLEACRPLLKSPDGVSDESRWTDTNDAKLGPYRLSKAIAEQAAWDFMAKQSGPTTLTVILLGRKHVFSSAKAQAVLGWKPRPAASAIVDCAQSLIATGAV